MEDPIISGVVTEVSEAKVTVFGVPDRPGISAALFEPLAGGQRQRRHDRPEHVDRRHTDISFMAGQYAHSCSPMPLASRASI